MKLRMIYQFLGTLLAVMLFSTQAIAQGTTTGTIRGVVTDMAGEPLIGANVSAVHLPTGTFYGNATDLAGFFRLNNVRVGGPYRITVSYTGYQDQVYEGINIRLGETYRIDVELSEGAVELDAIVVRASAGTTGENAGTATQITEEDIDLMPTLNRDLNDFTRLTPQAKTTFDGGFSIAGINNRYNAIYIDGAVNNDVFGLASSGTNGGQTGVAPISIDAIDQIQVVLSPYDVTLGGFAGGGINAVTRSGTNEVKGTVYYFMQNENLAGETNESLTARTGDSPEKLAEFSQSLYGLSLGGPIVKDKIFFFANAEIEKRETPVPFSFDIYEGDSDQSDLDQLSNFLQSEYGYDPGGYLGKTDKLDAVRLFGKVDFNLSNEHKLTLRHQYTKAEETDVNRSSSSRINFRNNGIFFPSTTNSFAAELNSQLGSFSNNLIIGVTTVRDDRDPIGSDFPYLDIDDGQGNIQLGSEQFSTANALDQDIYTLTDNFKLYKGNHTLTFGTHNEFSSFYNLFIRQNYGVYEYDSLGQFLNKLPASDYTRSYSLVDDKTGDGSAAAAEFNTLQLGFYVQDEWTVSNNFTLTAGLRLDIPFITTDPTTNEQFNNTTVDSIEQVYNLEGARVGKMPEGQLMWSPRLGFEYNFNNKSYTVLRGGLGIFTSRIPFVWPGGAYVNNGLTIGGVDGDDIEGEIEFRPDIQNQYVNESFVTPSGQVDLFAKDFKYPQVFRTNLAIDHELPGGVFATLEGMYTKILNNVAYKNVNNDPTVEFNWTNGGDDRPVFVREDLDPTYSAIYLGTNTDEGFTYNLTASLSKEFDFGLKSGLAYTYGEAEALYEGTSSQNSSQWRGTFNVDGRNEPVVGRSDFSIGHRVIGRLGYKFNWNEGKNIATTFSLFYVGESGAPYSYVYGGRSARNINNETGSTSRNRSLIWIPESANDIALIDYTSGGETITAAEQWNMLNTFIEQDDYLSENRGSYAEKNASRTPFTNQLDLRVLQDFAVNAGGKSHKLQISLDVFNLANLLNSEWGVRYINPFDYQLIRLEGYAADGTTPQFTFREQRLDDERFDINDRLSRWRMRLGLRYIFN